MTVPYSPEELDFRSIEPDEIPAWLAFLAEEIFPDDPPEAVRSIWESNEERSAGGIFAAIDPKGNIVGSVVAERRVMRLCGSPLPIGIIAGAGIKKEYRGRGLSRKLFEMCHEYLYAAGVAAAYLFSEPDTLEFYLRLGYAACRKRPGGSFYRMFRLIRPIPVGGRKPENSREFADMVDTAEDP